MICDIYQRHDGIQYAVSKNGVAVFFRPIQATDWKVSTVIPDLEYFFLKESDVEIPAQVKEVTPLDHGVLNLPLSKRGNFHKELDEYIASEKRQAEDRHFLAISANKVNRELASQMFKSIDPVLLRAEAVKRGLKTSTLKTIIRDLCNDRPKAALIVLATLI